MCNCMKTMGLVFPQALNWKKAPFNKEYDRMISLARTTLQIMFFCKQKHRL